MTTPDQTTPAIDDAELAAAVDWLRQVAAGTPSVRLILDALERENERLRAYVRNQLCECVDEYGHDRPTPCDRCAVLGEDHRQAAEAAKGGGDGR